MIMEVIMEKKQNLSTLIDQADRMSEAEIEQFGKKAKMRIKTAYSWELIADKYKKVFTGQV